MSLTSWALYLVVATSVPSSPAMVSTFPTQQACTEAAGAATVTPHPGNIAFYYVCIPTH